MIEARIHSWLTGPFDEKTKEEIRQLQKKDPKELSEAFSQDISFGTGGMRGLLGIGPNRMNVYTIRRATQGFANYLKKQPYEKIAVFIGYDVRHQSKEFAEEAAAVFESSGITVYLSEDVCPTPLVSFACRHLSCQGAVMITASHNPPQYNGYKAYWKDGGQVVPPHDTGIMHEIEKLPFGAPLDASSTARIHHVGASLDEAYLAQNKTLQLHPELAGSPLKIIYSPLHGTGIRLVPKALASWGYTHVSLVQKQTIPDPNFSTAPSPNPEAPQALALGTAQLQQEKADLFLATDPDADRIGVVLPGPLALTGNQTACLLLHHICSSQKKLPPNAACIKTIVTTELFRAIAEDYGCTCIDVLTGFKYIAEKISEWETSFGGYQYLFGAEESYGCLFGTHVRDKDALSAACLIAEAAALAHKEGLTLKDRLDQLYQKYGVYRETLLTLSFPATTASMNQMSVLMQNLRSHPPTHIGTLPVIKLEDYLSGHLPLPKSDVLRFWLSDKSKLVIRPSGTEPKVKIYAEVVGKEVAECDARLHHLVTSFQKSL